MSQFEQVPALADGRPEFTVTSVASAPEFAVWVAHLYGYALAGMTATDISNSIQFVRDDGHAARRRAAYMRNPQADPSFVPPFTWRTNTPFGFNPPGWHPAVRISGMPPQDAKDLMVLAGLTRAARYSPLYIVLLFGAVPLWFLLKSTDDWGWKVAGVLGVLALILALRQFGHRSSQQAAAARARKKWGPGA